MEFDDPLDLLSEGSNDSFFEDPKSKKSKPKETSKKPEDILNMFALQPDKEPTQPKAGKSDWLGIKSDVIGETLQAREPPKTASTLFDSNTTIDRKDDEPKNIKKSSLMQGLFGEPSEQKAVSFDFLNTATTTTKESMSVTSVTKKEDVVPPSTAESSDITSKQPRRMRRGLDNLLDPLGILQSTSESKPSAQSTAPKFLRDNVKPKSETVDNKPLENPEIRKTPVEEQVPVPVNPEPPKLSQGVVLPSLEFQNMSLQQQQYQLMLDMQMQNYQEKLIEIQRKQNDVLEKQERDFNVFLEKQFSKQQLVENNLKLQQERVNNCLQLMMLQTPDRAESEAQTKTYVTDNGKEFYEIAVADLKQEYERQMTLMEEFYKKEVSSIKQFQELTEERLRQEIADLKEHYENKLNQRKIHQEEEIEEFQNRIKKIHEQHGIDMENVRANHNRIYDEIKSEYATLLGVVKRKDVEETSVINKSSVYSEKLDTVTELLDKNTKLLKNTIDQWTNDYNRDITLKQNEIQIKSLEIKAVQESLMKRQEAIDNERSQMFNLVKALENRMVEQDNVVKEERWTLQQTAALLAARAAAFDREVEHFKSTVSWEREQIKVLKENLISENSTLQDFETKIARSLQKLLQETNSRISETLLTSKESRDVEIVRESTKLREEIEKLHRLRLENESIKSELQQKEKALETRERELENMMLSASGNNRKAERAFAEARIMEREYQERMKELKRQESSLEAKERRFAEDKLALSEEHLALHDGSRSDRKCDLCKAEKMQRTQLNTLFFAKQFSSENDFVEYNLKM